jgi:Na+-transporting methylmalonyl-CoA/oxaloacetate decarboxylase gamma subunit
MEEDGSTSIGEMLEVFFLLTSLGAGMVLLWLPIILLFATIMMFSLTKRKPSSDPLMEMIEN